MNAFLTSLFEEWLRERKRQYDETLSATCIQAYENFLAEEPDPVAVLNHAINRPHNCRKSLVPVDAAGRAALLAVKPRKERYALRTHRKQRTDRNGNTPDRVFDTVYKPRSQWNFQNKQQTEV